MGRRDAVECERSRFQRAAVIQPDDPRIREPRSLPDLRPDGLRRDETAFDAPSSRCSVSGSRWSVWMCETVTTSTNPIRPGSTGIAVSRTWGLSDPAYLRVRESDRYGSNSSAEDFQRSRNPLWPSHHNRNSSPEIADCMSASSASSFCTGWIS